MRDGTRSSNPSRPGALLQLSAARPFFFFRTSTRSRPGKATRWSWMPVQGRRSMISFVRDLARRKTDLRGRLVSSGDLADPVSPPPQNDEQAGPDAQGILGLLWRDNRGGCPLPKSTPSRKPHGGLGGIRHHTAAAPPRHSLRRIDAHEEGSIFDPSSQGALTPRPLPALAGAARGAARDSG